MRQKTYQILGCLATALLLSGCSQSDDNLQEADNPVPVTMTVGIGQAATRAQSDLQSNRFRAGEVFHAYFPADITVTRTDYTIQSQVAQAEPADQPFVKKSALSPVVHAYYPSTVSETTAEFTVRRDQSDNGDYMASDLMYATTTIDPKGHADLVFSHRMSKVIIRAKAGRGLTRIIGVKVVKGYLKVDIATPLTATPGSTLSDEVGKASPLVLLKNNLTGSSDCAALLPPQTIDSSENFLEVETDGGIAYFNLADDLTMDGGKSYTFEFNVDVTNIGLTATITPWVVNPQQNVDTEL